MSSLNEFLKSKPEPEKPANLGEEIDMSYMCACGSSHTKCYTKDSFRSAVGVCQECGVTGKITIPNWMKEIFG